MDLDFLTHFMAPIIIGLCLCVGYIVKKWVRDVDNKYIPTLCALLGLALAVWMHWPEVTAESMLTGMVSGLASTGLHQVFRQLVGDTEYK